MKKIAIVLAAAASISASGVYAGFGSLSNLSSSLSESVTGVSSSNMDLNGFFTQAKATNAMFIQSRTALASLLASKQDSDELKAKQKSLKTTSDLKEKEALEKKYEMEFPFGAGKKADAFATAFIAKFGRDEFDKIAKQNFANFRNLDSVTLI